MTILERLVQYVDKNPGASDIEIADAINTNKKTVQEYLRRLTNREVIRIVNDAEGNRQILVLELPEITPADFKKDIYEIMIARYLEDFKNADSFQDRVEIGKMVVRILDKY